AGGFTPSTPKTIFNLIAPSYLSETLYPALPQCQNPIAFAPSYINTMELSLNPLANFNQHSYGCRRC
ncbi:MAG: hypothetical protein K6T90_03520, partial [Leptolyngbyaceae cyanobacterium HOT.MB2.61]|nr:hypothetical protein [Leptolyngbyaceae cyanobacterium HOT.MB2.61]